MADSRMLINIKDQSWIFINKSNFNTCINNGSKFIRTRNNSRRNNVHKIKRIRVCIHFFFRIFPFLLRASAGDLIICCLRQMINSRIFN